MIKRRGGLPGLSDAAGFESRSPARSSCRAAVNALQADPTPGGLRRAGDVYRSGWAIDPKLVFSGMNVDERVSEEQRACLGLTLSIFRFVGQPLAKGAPEVPETATSFMPPVRDYFDPLRDSFGHPTGSRGPFRDSVHCGDDVAMDEDNSTVVAIANGIVRRVSFTYSWGFIVIVEHQLPGREGAYCSLYAHLAASISVSPGQVVRKGERIGAVGRSNTWENGGYISHVHFGIHRGPYLQIQTNSVASSPNPSDASGSPDVTRNASWITGYLEPGRWADNMHGWVDPQAFIRKRRA